MNRLDGTESGSYKDYNLPHKKENLIEKLPLEIFEHILSNLDDGDLQQASLLSRTWNVAAVDAAKRDEIVRIQKFTEFLAENLKGSSYENQRQKLLAIQNPRQILDSKNLIEIKSSIFILKEMILDILKELNEIDLMHLSDLVDSNKELLKPRFFRNLLELAVLYKRLQRTKETGAQDYEAKDLSLIAKKLAEHGEFAKATEVAKTIPNWLVQIETLVSFSNQQVIDIIIKDANKISSKFQKSQALKTICRALAERGDIKQAFEIRETIPNQYDKNYSIIFIIKALTKKGDYGKAIELANNMTETNSKNAALADIVEVLIKIGDLDRAIEIADTITDDYKRNNLITDICRALAEKGEINLSLLIINNIEETSLKISALYTIRRELSVKGNKKQASEVQNIIDSL